MTAMMKLKRAVYILNGQITLFNTPNVMPRYCVVTVSLQLTPPLSTPLRSSMHWGTAYTAALSLIDILNTIMQVLLYSNWNGTLCSQYNRSGTLCGGCKSGYGPAVYSFSLRCVECHNVVFWKRLLLYILIAYGPLTVFLVIIVFFTISVKSAPLHGWIFVSQIITCPFYMRTLTRMAELNHIDQYSYKMFTSFYGIWNLDFFRTVYSPFCLHSNLTTFQVLSLDYIIAAYPLVAILLMYVLVDMYSRNYRPVVVMWKPFHYCCIRFRHQLNIKVPLINAFGTFFCLSYVKIFNTAIDLLTPTKVWDENGEVSYHAYVDGTQLMFQSGHLPFALLSILLLIIFNFLPLILLLIFAFPKTRFCIPTSLQNVLYPFIDDILSCYKDGHNGTPNRRYTLLSSIPLHEWYSYPLSCGLRVYSLIHVQQ